MIAFVRFGNTQLKVQEGDTVSVFPLKGIEGNQVTLPVVAVLDGENLVVEEKKLASYRVRCEVLEVTKGEKIYSFRKKPKTGYKRGVGHRDRLMKLKVVQIERSETDS